jgi:hypothetical protein
VETPGIKTYTEIKNAGSSDKAVQNLVLSGKPVGIKIPSNIDLNLNGSTIKAWPNNLALYTVFFIQDVSNVSIHNGKIEGDRYGHITNWHEWGHGIRIINASHIKVFDLEIYDMMGDGILISDIMEPNLMRTKDIQIFNNDIHHCRRNNISIIAGDQITISHNLIYCADDTRPMAGIDIERNTKSGDYEQFCTNITISENKIYGNGSQNGINVFGGVENISIINNELGDYLQLRKNHYPGYTIEEIMKNQNIMVSGNKVIQGIDYEINVTEENVNKMVYRDVV